MSTPFDDLINKLRNPGEEGLPEGIYDDLTAEYHNVFDGSQTAIKTREEKIAELEANVTALKNKNYDLLIASSGATTEIVDENSNGDEPVEPSIDSLFTKAKRR